MLFVHVFVDMMTLPAQLRQLLGLGPSHLEAVHLEAVQPEAVQPEAGAVNSWRFVVELRMTLLVCHMFALPAHEAEEGQTKRILSAPHRKTTGTISW
jgi:hypothetical protein